LHRSYHTFAFMCIQIYHLLTCQAAQYNIPAHLRPQTQEKTHWQTCTFLSLQHTQHANDYICNGLSLRMICACQCVTPPSSADRFAEYSASQCGFCTPGFIVATHQTLTKCQEKGQKPTEDILQKGLDGNLCRCTGYRPILDACKVSRLSSCFKSLFDHSFNVFPLRVRSVQS